jgi:hypothetical protein
MVKATSSNELVSVHAVRQQDGKVNVLVINKDPSTRYNVTVSLSGAQAHGWAGVYRYGMGSTAIAGSRKRVHGSSFAVAVEPYSLTTVRLP